MADSPDEIVPIADQVALIEDESSCAGQHSTQLPKCEAPESAPTFSFADDKQRQPALTQAMPTGPKAAMPAHAKASAIAFSNPLSFAPPVMQSQLQQPVSHPSSSPSNSSLADLLQSAKSKPLDCTNNSTGLFGGSSFASMTVDYGQFSWSTPEAEAKTYTNDIQARTKNNIFSQHANANASVEVPKSQQVKPEQVINNKASSNNNFVPPTAKNYTEAYIRNVRSARNSTHSVIEAPQLAHVNSFEFNFGAGLASSNNNANHSNSGGAISFGAKPSDSQIEKSVGGFSFQPGGSEIGRSNDGSRANTPSFSFASASSASFKPSEIVFSFGPPQPILDDTVAKAKSNQTNAAQMVATNQLSGASDNISGTASDSSQQPEQLLQQSSSPESSGVATGVLPNSEAEGTDIMGNPAFAQSPFWKRVDQSGKRAKKWDEPPPQPYNPFEAKFSPTLSSFDSNPLDPSNVVSGEITLMGMQFGVMQQPKYFPAMSIAAMQNSATQSPNNNATTTPKKRNLAAITDPNANSLSLLPASSTPGFVHAFASAQPLLASDGNALPTFMPTGDSLEKLSSVHKVPTLSIQEIVDLEKQFGGKVGMNSNAFKAAKLLLLLNKLDPIYCEKIDLYELKPSDNKTDITSVTPEIVSKILQFTQLTSLSLAHYEISVSNIMQFSSLTNLTELDLRHCLLNRYSAHKSLSWQERMGGLPVARVEAPKVDEIRAISSFQEEFIKSQERKQAESVDFQKRANEQFQFQIMRLQQQSLDLVEGSVKIATEAYCTSRSTDAKNDESDSATTTQATTKEHDTPSSAKALPQSSPKATESLADQLPIYYSPADDCDLNVREINPLRANPQQHANDAFLAEYLGQAGWKGRNDHGREGGLRRRELRLEMDPANRTENLTGFFLNFPRLKSLTLTASNFVTSSSKYFNDFFITRSEKEAAGPGNESAPSLATASNNDTNPTSSISAATSNNTNSHCGSAVMQQDEVGPLALQTLIANEGLFHHLPSLFLAKYQNLTALDMSMNILDDLDPNLFTLTRLKTLSLKHFKGKRLPIEFRNLKQLTNLNLLCSFGLEQFSFEPFLAQRLGLTNLESFRLSASLGTNKLRTQAYSLPAEIGLMTNLKALVLTSTKLLGFSTEISKLTNLTELTLSNNLLSSIPWEFNYLPSLTRLDLSQNKLREFNISIYKNFSQLKQLCICENPFQSQFMRKISLRKGQRKHKDEREEKLTLCAHKFLCFVKAKDYCYFILTVLQSMMLADEEQGSDRPGDDGVANSLVLSHYFIPNDIIYSIVTLIYSMLVRDLERSNKFAFSLATDRY